MENQGIRDARQLGVPKMLILGLQHMFAMFGATVLVPALTGLSVSATLLFAGLGTLLFHFLVKGKVPAFLGSSFAFLAGYAAIAPNGEAALLPYAAVPGTVRAGQELWHREGHELLPAGRHRPDHHLHRHDAGQLRHQ